MFEGGWVRSSGAGPTTTRGRVAADRAGHNEAETNSALPGAPTKRAIDLLKASPLPFVSSASSAADARGVSTPGIAADATVAASRTRWFRSRSSFLSWTERAPNDNAAVIAKPTARTTIALEWSDGRRAFCRALVPAEESSPAVASAIAPGVLLRTPDKVAQPAPRKNIRVGRLVPGAPATKRSPTSWHFGARSGPTLTRFLPVSKIGLTFVEDRRAMPVVRDGPKFRTLDDGAAVSAPVVDVFALGTPPSSPGSVEGKCSRLARTWRGPVSDPSWVRPALLLLLAVTAALYLWDLGASGWANAYYSAAVQAGTKSWKAFFFGSTDASNFITVDKTPASLWVMELSARIFGVNSWSVLAPQALEGVAAVGILFATVKRWFSPVAALIAATVFALTPVAALMFRFNNPDALLVMLLVGAAYTMTRALEDERLRWIVVTGALVGLSFL